MSDVVRVRRRETKQVMGFGGSGYDFDAVLDRFWRRSVEANIEAFHPEHPKWFRFQGQIDHSFPSKRLPGPCSLLCPPLIQLEKPIKRIV